MGKEQKPNQAAATGFSLDGFLGAQTGAMGPFVPAGGAVQNQNIGIPNGYRAPNIQGPVSANRAERVYNEPYAEGTELARLSGLSAEAVAQLQLDMRTAGLIGPNQRFRLGDYTDPVTQKAFYELLGVANQKGISFPKAIEYLKTKPFGEFDENGRFVGGSGGGGGGGGFSGPRTTKSTQKSISLTDPTSARSIIRNTLREKLGRAPSKAEYEAFVGALNSTERNSPNVTTQTTTVNEDGSVSNSSSTSQGGVNPSGFAEEYAQQGELGKEANSFMVATDYYDAAMQALRSPV